MPASQPLYHPLMLYFTLEFVLLSERLFPLWKLSSLSSENSVALSLYAHLVRENLSHTALQSRFQIIYQLVSSVSFKSCASPRSAYQSSCGRCNGSQSRLYHIPSMHFDCCSSRSRLVLLPSSLEDLSSCFLTRARNITC